MVYRFIVKQRYIEFVSKIYSKKMNMLKLSKETGVYYPQTIIILRQFEKEKLIKPIFIKDAVREYEVELTKKGNALYHLLNSLKDLHEDVDPKEILIKLKGKKI